MKCKRGHEDWYVRGRYKRCNVCFLDTVARHYQNKKLGTSPETREHKYQLRPLSQMLSLMPSDRTTCNKGHELKDNVRYEVTSRGLTQWRCKTCEAFKTKRRYGIKVESTLKEMLGKDESPWDVL